MVSDGDTDGSWRVSEAFGAKVFPLPTSKARARNIGAKAAREDILFFMDGDVTVHPNTRVYTADGSIFLPSIFHSCDTPSCRYKGLSQSRMNFLPWETIAIAFIFYL